MIKYSTVLFDADGTLFDFSRCEDEAFREALLRSGISPSDEMVREYQKINDGLWKALERKEIAREVLVFRRFELFAERYGFTLDSEKTARDYADCLSEKVYFIEGARETVASLYGKVRLYIVTNGIKRVQRRRYEKSGFSELFDGIFISEEIGVNKPDPRFFERVAERVENFDKATTLVVGDSLSSDIKGGGVFGLDTAWFNPDAYDSSETPTYTIKRLCELNSIIFAEETDERA